MTETADRLPAAIRPLYDTLFDQVCGLHDKWMLYLEFFGEKKDTGLLSDMAPAAFMTIENSIRDALIMAFGRLTDPAATTGKPNVCLERLLDELEPHCEPAFHAGAKSNLQAIRTHLQPVKEIRNRTVGHTDYHTAFGTHPQPLARLTRAHFEQSAVLIARLMNDVGTHFGLIYVGYEYIRRLGDGTTVLDYLRRAKAALAHGAPDLPE